jgi:CHASE3 domain sensor protein
MSSDVAFQTLVIILSITLAIFLVAMIVFSILGIKLLKKVNNFADSAEIVSNNIEALSTSMKNAASPLAVLRILRSGFKGVKRK